jgi:very-short-patch-repair endonuclease
MLPRRRPRTVTFAQTLRKRMTKPERILWSKLRAYRFHSYKFRRQYPLGPWIADFACPEKMLIIEIDGGDHWMRKEKDARRDAAMKKDGFAVLRFTNLQVYRHLEWVLETILHALEGRS